MGSVSSLVLLGAHVGQLVTFFPPKQLIFCEKFKITILFLKKKTSFKQDWCSSRDFADLLLQESRWSRAIYGYQKASFMIMMRDKLVGDQDQELLQLFKYEYPIFF